MKEILQLTQNLTFTNLDLLSVGVTIAAIALLGFIVYISNTKSITNISFLLFCGVTIFWSFFNYISYQTNQQNLTLNLWKIVIFLGFWHSFSFFNFLYVFPRERVLFPNWYKFILVPFVGAVSLWALFGKLVFSGTQIINNISQPVVGKGIIIFVITVCTLIISSFIFLIKKIIKAQKNERKSYKLILVGALITFALLFTSNLILPATLNITKFIPLGAITFFPFSVCTAYAIFKHKAFNVKHLGSTIMAFFLCMATFVEIIFAQNFGQLVLRSGIFFFVLLISAQFVKNIFALEKLSENLEDANEKLKSLDKLKSEFISLASHQLRSPLTVIKGYASTLTDGVVGDLTTKQQEIVHHIYTSAQGLASVVEDFLNVSKIEQGGLKYTFSPTNLSETVQNLVTDMKIAAEDKHLTFTSSINVPKSCLVSADVVKLRQVFLNLIDNSIKYTKEGFVNVSLTHNKKDKTLVFSVSDSGIGISKETREKLFTKFGRGEGGVLNSGGSGLGLYLAQEIVTAHKGTVSVESDGINKGSSFIVSIPCEE